MVYGIADVCDALSEQEIVVLLEPKIDFPWFGSIDLRMLNMRHPTSMCRLNKSSPILIVG